MTKNMTKLDAIALAQSPRGQYILSQALTIAINTMEEVEPFIMREVSNIADMRLIRDQLFPLFTEIQAVQDE